MSEKRFVLMLLENSARSSVDFDEIGYWDGKTYRADEANFPGAFDDPHDKRVKVYKTYKGAEKAVSNLASKFPYVRNARIVEL